MTLSSINTFTQSVPFYFYFFEIPKTDLAHYHYLMCLCPLLYNQVHALDPETWKTVEVVHIDIADKSQVEPAVSSQIFNNNRLLLVSLLFIKCLLRWEKFYFYKQTD